MLSGFVGSVDNKRDRERGRYFGGGGDLKIKVAPFRFFCSPKILVNRIKNKIKMSNGVTFEMELSEDDGNMLF